MRESATSSSWNAPAIEQSWSWSREQLEKWQLEQLNAQLSHVLPANAFYHSKFEGQPTCLSSLDQLHELPLTTKQELVDSASHSPLGISAHHTFGREAYSRLHRTSGTSGKPLIIMDTAEDWRWWSATWQHVLRAAGIGAGDRVFMAFSFGPFIGFWSAHQACIDCGATVVPGGGLNSLARLEFMRETQVNCVCCTPSYALHLAAVAEQEDFDLRQLGIRRLIVAGEAGGSVPAVRAKMEAAWCAQVIDHSGATEIGPWGFGLPDRSGLHIIETSFIAEYLPLDDNHQAHSGAADLRQLVLTSLGRYGAPLFRYQTGDIVCRESSPHPACNFAWLPQGVVGRADDMVTIRGVNVFPSGIDAVVREEPGVVEYRVIISRNGELDQLRIETEISSEAEPKSTLQHIEKLLTIRLGLRIPVSQVTAGSLPRSELKARRWIDRRSE